MVTRHSHDEKQTNFTRQTIYKRHDIYTSQQLVENKGSEWGAVGGLKNKPIVRGITTMEDKL